MLRPHTGTSPHPLPSVKMDTHMQELHLDQTTTPYKFVASGKPGGASAAEVRFGPCFRKICGPRPDRSFG